MTRPLLVGRHLHLVSVGNRALENLLGQRVLQVLLDNPLQRTGAVGGIIAAFREPRRRLAVEVDRDLPSGQQFAQAAKLDLDDRRDILALEPVKQDDFIEPVQELGPEMPAHDRHHLAAHRVRILVLAERHQVVGPQIRSHDDKGIAKIDRAPLAVGEPPVIEHLQEDIENVRVGFFDLVEQHHLVGPAPHCFGKRAAFVIADVSRRGADEACHRVLLHVLRHVNAKQRMFVVEKEFGERSRKFGLADAGRTEKHE